MATGELRYLHAYRDRHGKWRYYFRYKGKRTALPGNRDRKDLSDRKLLTAYTAQLAKIASSDDMTKRHHGPGSLGEVIRLYLNDPFTFGQMAEGTKREWRRCLEDVAAKHGFRRFDQMALRHLEAIRDEHSEKPGAANNYVDALKSLCKWGKKKDLREDNPAVSLERYNKRRSYDAWTQADIDAFLKVADERAKLALYLLLYTGQRRGDVAKMTWHDYDGSMIYVAQEKEDAKLYIPCHKALREVLSETKRTGVTILTTARGRSFTSNSLGIWFSDFMDEANLRKGRGLVVHGLRAAAASHLAEAGCTDFEVAAITGHKTLAMVQHYTKGAKQKRRAVSAIKKLEDES